MANVVLIPANERPIWPNTPLATIVDVLNFAAAEWNGGRAWEGWSKNKGDDWRAYLSMMIDFNHLKEIKSKNASTEGQTFFMGFGGSHFFVHDLTGERAYILYAAERGENGWLRF